MDNRLVVYTNGVLPIGSDEVLSARDEALEARDDAVDAADRAEDSAEQVAEDRTAVEDARDVAVDARDVAVDARDEAVDARDEAVDARDEAVDARDEAVDARDEAVDALADVQTALAYVIPQKFGAPADGVGDDAPAILAALAASKRVYMPPGNYRIGSTLVIPEGGELFADPDSVYVAAPIPLFMTMTSISNASVKGLIFTGPHSGTSYNIIVTDCERCSVDVEIRNGNSGINLIRSNNCKAILRAFEMRATAIRLSGSKDNKVDLVEGRNVGGFGVYGALDGELSCSGNEISANKYASADHLTPYQSSGETGSAFYDPVTGRIGLEGIGITKGNDGNTFLKADIKSTKDNGISITSDYNTGGNFRIDSCHHDGLHIYGAHNAFTSVVTTRNRFSGLGIGRSETEGNENYNSVFGFMSDDNGQYGARIGSDATGNTISGTVGPNNELGAYLDGSTGTNDFLRGESTETNSAQSQITFATPGDLAPSYAEREALFRVSGGWCDFYVRLRFTLVYTTASGELRISVPGLPQGTGNPVLPVGEMSATIDWPSGATQIAARLENGSVLRVRAFGPSMAPVSLGVENFPSGVQHTMAISGRFKTT